MAIVLFELPEPIDDVGQATVRYIRNIASDTRFAKDIVLWLTEERRERHRERINDSRCVITYEVGDMIMARVQVNSNAKTGVVGKLSIESRGPFKVAIDHGNGSYTVVPFDKPNGTKRKFLAQDMYALPPQILPYDQVDLPDLRYMNNDFAPVTHPFKDSFNIESYNSIWFEKQPPSSKPTLQVYVKTIYPLRSKHQLNSLPPLLHGQTLSKKWTRRLQTMPLLHHKPME